MKGLKDFFRAIGIKETMNRSRDNLEDHGDYSFRSKDACDLHATDGEEMSGIYDKASRLRRNIDNRNDRILDEIRQDPSFIREIVRTNNRRMSYEGLIEDLYVDSLSGIRIPGIKKMLICDVDHTITEGGNLTYDPYDEDALSFVNVGLKMGVFDPADDLFLSYKSESDASSGSGKKILDMGGYDHEYLSHLDLKYSRGFAEVYRLDKRGGFDNINDVFFTFMSELIRHPERSCLPETFLQDIMLMERFCDDMMFASMSQDMVIRMLLESANMLLPEPERGKIKAVGSKIIPIDPSRKSRIDIENDKQLKRCVRLAHGPSKISMLENIYRFQSYCTCATLTETLDRAYMADPTCLEPIGEEGLKDVIALNIPYCSLLDHDERYIQKIMITDNLEDIAGISSLKGKNDEAHDKIICNVIDNMEWSEKIKRYAESEGAEFNSIERPTDFVINSVIENNIYSILRDYGPEKMRDICSYLQSIEGLKRERYYEPDCIEKAHDEIYELKEMLSSFKGYDASKTLIGALAEFELNNKDVSRIGNVFKSSGLWCTGPEEIEYLQKRYGGILLQDDGPKESRPYMENEILRFKDIVSDVYEYNNNALFGKMLSRLVDPEDIASYLSGSDGGNQLSGDGDVMSGPLYDSARSNRELFSRLVR